MKLGLKIATEKSLDQLLQTQQNKIQKTKIYAQCAYDVHVVLCVWLCDCVAV
jgi:hypothetical protein